MFAIIAVAAGFLSGSDDRASVRSVLPAGPQTSETTLADGAPGPDGAGGAGVDVSDPTGGGHDSGPAGGGAPQGGRKIDDGGIVPPEPQPELQPEPRPVPAHLVVAPDPVNLKSGVPGGRGHD